MVDVDPGNVSLRSSRRVRVAVSVLVVLSLIALSAPATLAFSQDAFAIDPKLDQGLLGEGRQAFRERADRDRAIDAYRLFKQNLDQNPEDVVAAWHFSLATYYLGMRVYRDPKLREAVHLEGREAADRALERDPNCGPCHLLSAVNHALWAEQVGIFRTLVGLPKVKRHLARAAELDPTFAGAAAFRVQASIAEVLPRMFGGGKQRARRFIEQAIALVPNEPLNYEVLVDLLVEHYDDPVLALAVARRGLAVPIPGPAYVESLDSIAYLRRFVDFHTMLLSTSRR